MRRSNLIYNLIIAAVFIFLETVALKIVHNNGELQDNWFSKGMHTISGTVWGSSQNIRNYFSLKERNDSLALENYRLKVQLAKLEGVLPDSLATVDDGVANGFKYSPATIIKISNNKQHNYIIIDKGSDDGITDGSGVITSKGAIGVIDAVGKNFSYARSFKNHGMNVSARIGRNGAIGPLTWDGYSSNGALLNEIPHHVEINPGDTIYTSGYSSIFPPDIPLGTAGEAKIVNGGTYEIKVSLFEDYGVLRYVTVVENLGRDEIKSLEDEQ